MIFLSQFLDMARISMPTVSFITQLDSLNALLLECFPLTYYPKVFKSRTNRHILIVGSVTKLTEKP